MMTIKVLGNNALFILFLCVFAPSYIAAQQAQLRATIVDAESKAPIIAASAALLQHPSRTYVQGMQTNTQGELHFQDLPAGQYILQVSYVGKENLEKLPVTLTAKQQLALGVLEMKSDGTLIDEVVVQGRTPALRLDIDKKVFDASQSLVSVGGTASDLLANVPTLQVEMDGSVSLRGSSSVRILIDGKESAMAGNDINAFLQSLPANAIDKVEIITNPSAKYDAEGQSGIINLVLKKNIRTGLNGNINASVGSYDNYMAGLTLNYRDNKFNYYGTYSFNKRHQLGSGAQNNRYLNNNSEINNTEESTRKGMNNTVKLGVDYYLSDRTTLGLSGNLSVRENDRGEDFYYTYLNHPDFSGTSTRQSRQQEDDLGYDLSFDAVHKLQREGSELLFNFSYGSDTEDGVNTFDQVFSTVRPRSNRVNNTSESGNTMNIQLDYLLPLGEEQKLELGYRSMLRNSFDTQFSNNLDLTSNSYVPDYSISNDFDLSSAVHALYANYQNTLTSRLAYQVGLRAEQADLQTTYFSKDPNVDPSKAAIDGSLNYFRLYPSVFLTYQVGENEDKIQWNYSRRVQRPRGWQVNPFEDVSDDMNRRQGNPELMPEDIHSFEMSYAKFYQKWNFLTTAYYRKMNDVMQSYIFRVDPETSVTYSKWENLTDAQVAGMELLAKVELFPWWDMTWNGNLMYNKLAGNSDFDIQERENFTWSTNLSTNVKFTPTWTMQLKGDYFAPRLLAQGKTKSFKGVDLAVKKEVMAKKGNISLNVRDLFDSRQFGFTTFTPQLQSEGHRRWGKRMFTLSFSYNFGIQDPSRKKNTPSGNMEDGGGDF